MITMLAAQKWSVAFEKIRSSDPFSYAVVDDFLRPDAARALRAELLSSSHWHSREITRRDGNVEWVAKQWFNDCAHLPLVQDLEGELERIFDALEKCRAANRWAIACSENLGHFPHCDGGALSVNLWLTPEKHHLAGSGGMVLFDVKRKLAMAPLEYASASGGCVEYVSRHAVQAPAVVSYRYNRAVVFDAWTFHSTDLLRFGDDDFGSARLNLTFTFDLANHGALCFRNVARQEL